MKNIVSFLSLKNQNIYIWSGTYNNTGSKKEIEIMKLTIDEIKEMNEAIVEFEEMGLICGSEEIGISDEENENTFFGLSTGKFLYLI